MIVFKEARCGVSGQVSEVALIIVRPVPSLWPISGQQPVYATQKYQLSSLENPAVVRLKKVPGTKYQVPHFGDRNAKKGGPSQGELSWYWGGNGH